MLLGLLRALLYTPADLQSVTSFAIKMDADSSCSGWPGRRFDLGLLHCPTLSNVCGARNPILALRKSSALSLAYFSLACSNSFVHTNSHPRMCLEFIFPFVLIWKTSIHYSVFSMIGWFAHSSIILILKRALHSLQVGGCFLPAFLLDANEVELIEHLNGKNWKLSN